MTGIFRAIVFGIFLTSSMGVVHAQDVVELPLNLQSGDLLQISYSHERSDNGQTNGGHIVAEILIGDVEPDSFRATWTTISMEFGGILFDRSSPEAANMMLGIPIGYISDRAGTPIRIEDKDELLDTIIETIVENPAAQPVDMEAIAQTRALFESMNDEALATAFLKIPSAVAICHDTALVPGQPNEAHVEIPSPIGTATTVNGVVTYLLDGIDAEQGKARVEYRSTLDPEGVEQLVRDLLTQIAGPEGIPESELTGMSIERNESASCEISIENGLAESVTYVTETKILDQARTETLVISTVLSSP